MRWFMLALVLLIVGIRRQLPTLAAICAVTFFVSLVTLLVTQVFGQRADK